MLVIIKGGFTEGISEYLTQAGSQSTDWNRISIQVLKGMGKGAVIGTTEVGIVTTSIFISPLAGILGVGTALTFGEGIIEPAWDISSARSSSSTESLQDVKPLEISDTLLPNPSEIFKPRLAPLTYAPSQKPGDESYRSDPETEKHIEKKLEKRKRTKSEGAKEEWRRRYREVFG